MERSHLTWGGGENRPWVVRGFCFPLLSISQSAFYNETLRVNEWMSQFCRSSHKVQAGGLVRQTQSTPPPKGFVLHNITYSFSSCLNTLWHNYIFCQSVDFSIQFLNRNDTWRLFWFIFTRHPHIASDWIYLLNPLVGVVFNLTETNAANKNHQLWARTGTKNNITSFHLIQ